MEFDSENWWKRAYDELATKHESVQASLHEQLKDAEKRADELEAIINDIAELIDEHGLL